MSSGISQIEYWREVNKPDKNNVANTKSITEGGPGAIYLSYDVFLGLTVIGGFLALDHLYLRSPLTFIAKIIVNILTLGSWWLYDASQAVFNRDVVKVFGLGVPGLGPKGIAAGVLASDVPDKKHMSFFIYGLAIILGGLFGLDSFIVGDKQSGFIRLICLITGLLAPIAIFWWLYNLGKFLFKTKDVVNQYWEYFGAPPPAEYGMTLGEKLATKFPFLQTIFGPINRVKSSVENVIKTSENVAEALAINPVETIITKPLNSIENKLDNVSDVAGEILTGPVRVVGERVNKILQNTVTKVEDELKPAIETALVPISGAITTAIEPVISAVAPIKQTLNAGIATAQTGLEVAKDGIALGKNTLNTGREIVGKTLNVVGQTADAATQALTLVPSAAALTSGLSTVAAQQALNKLNQQGGGSDSTILPYMMMGTLVIIIVSGLVITYHRYRQNEQPRKDDSPPNPETPITRVLRESN